MTVAADLQNKQWSTAAPSALTISFDRCQFLFKGRDI